MRNPEETGQVINRHSDPDTENGRGEYTRGKAPGVEYRTALHDGLRREIFDRNARRRHQKSVPVPNAHIPGGAAIQAKRIQSPGDLHDLTAQIVLAEEHLSNR